MTETASNETVSMPAVRSVPLVGDEPAVLDWATELVARAHAEGVELTGENSLFTGLVRQVLQTGLEVEMTDHLGYERTPLKVAAAATAATVPRPRRWRPRSARSTCECRETATSVGVRCWRPNAIAAGRSPGAVECQSWARPVAASSRSRATSPGLAALGGRMRGQLSTFRPPANHRPATTIVRS